MKQKLIDNIKNIYGWKTSRKIVVISVDDYGNVRLSNKQARNNLDEAGYKVRNRFDAYDALETKQDLEMLFDALSSVKDKNGNHAVFTPFSLSCNIDFDKMERENYEEYHYELLPSTFEKLSAKDAEAYEGAWKLVKQGVDEKLFIPQFHGREHFNLMVFNEKLEKKDPQLITTLGNRSYTGISDTGYTTITSSGAFEFWDFKENEAFDEIIADGLDKFQEVYGYKSTHFNSPGGREHPIIHKALKDNGIKFIDTPFIKLEHQHQGKYKKVFNYTGKKNKLGMLYLVRNVVFEPTEDRGFDWVNYALKQIETAFFWKRPAIVSSHRVNFCGYICQKNREIGITALTELLKRIRSKWPDVEFMSANELGELIDN